MKDNSFIIAELSANHNHDIEIAKKTIKAAAESGADAIKLQTYTPDTITIDCNNKYFILKDTIWKGKKLYDLYKEAYTPWEWHKDLFEYAKKQGLICFSTPFDKTAVDFLEELGNPIYKVASFEIIDIPLIKYIASKQKPIIISTGIANLADIELAIETCHKEGNFDVTLLKCTSSYPAPIEEANLKTMINMSETFNCKVGLSDHTIGSDVVIAAVTLGAKVIEKHFILNNELKTPDSSFSMTPDMFKNMVQSIRNVEKALGRIDYSYNKKKLRNRKLAKSIFIIKEVKEGESLSDKNIKVIRPGDGLHPKYYESLLGKKFNNDYQRGTPLNIDMIR